MAGESAADLARRQREKAARLLWSAQQYERGAEGERVTADLLARLPGSEWTIFNDLHWPGRPRANIDHVAVGPQGLFVIDTKNWSGTPSLRGDQLRVGSHRADLAVAAADEAAIAVFGCSPAAVPGHLKPVLCFVGDEPFTGRAYDVRVCTTASLLELMTKGPRLLDADQVRRVSLELQRSPASGQ